MLRRGIQVNQPPGHNSSLAAGYWGHNPKARVMEEQVPERIIKSNTDFLQLGVVVDIWLPPAKNLAILPTCSCVKTTNKSADVQCAKCHGLGRIPGYVKWGHSTYFFAAVALGMTGQSDAGPTIPPTIVKNTTTSMHTLALASGVATGSFETQDFGVDNPYSDGWALESLVYNRAPGNMHTVEWSLNRGSTWLKGDFTKLRLSRGTIRFRVTLFRQNAADLSPQFEILRFRHPCQDKPWIRIARPMGKRKRKRDEFGSVEEESGLSYWTVPLDQGTRALVNGQVVHDKVWLPENFIFEVLEGTFAGDRYAVVSYNRSEHMGIMTSQAFDVRRVQEGEIGAQVF